MTDTKMKLKYFEINPRDTLFFGDGTPFKKEISNWIQGKYIPFPSTFYGAVFSEILRQNINKIKNPKYINKDKFNEYLSNILVLKNIFIKYNGDCYIPAPLDLYPQEHYHYPLMSQYKKNNDKYDIIIPDKCLERKEKYFINLSDIKHYVCKNLNKIILKKESDFFLRESKVGIKLENRQAVDKHLYRLDMTRFKNEYCRFVIECQLNEEYSIEKSIIKLGGESKTADLRLTDKKYESLEKFKKIHNFDNENSYNYKVVFTSPVVFKNPIPNVSKIIGNHMGKRILIGGFDYKTGKQRKETGFDSGSIMIIKSDVKKNNIDELINDEYKTKGFGNYIMFPLKEDFTDEN